MYCMMSLRVSVKELSRAFKTLHFQCLLFWLVFGSGAIAGLPVNRRQRRHWSQHCCGNYPERRRSGFSLPIHSKGGICSTGQSGLCFRLVAISTPVCRLTNGKRGFLSNLCLNRSYENCHRCQAVSRAHAKWSTWTSLRWPVSGSSRQPFKHGSGVWIC